MTDVDLWDKIASRVLRKKVLLPAGESPDCEQGDLYALSDALNKRLRRFPTLRGDRVLIPEYTELSPEADHFMIGARVSDPDRATLIRVCEALECGNRTRSTPKLIKGVYHIKACRGSMISPVFFDRGLAQYDVSYANKEKPRLYIDASDLYPELSPTEPGKALRVDPITILNIRLADLRDDSTTWSRESQALCTGCGHLLNPLQNAAAAITHIEAQLRVTKVLELKYIKSLKAAEWHICGLCLRDPRHLEICSPQLFSYGSLLRLTGVRYGTFADTELILPGGFSVVFKRLTRSSPNRNRWTIKRVGADNALIVFGLFEEYIHYILSIVYRFEAKARAYEMGIPVTIA